MNAKYLIFGATGSIGSNLANQLYNSKYEYKRLSSNYMFFNYSKDRFKYKCIQYFENR